MKNIILPEENDSVAYLLNITPETKGIIIVYNGENAIGHITCDGDEYWNLSTNISIEPEMCEDHLIDLVKRILEKYKNSTFKLLEFK